LDSRPWSWIAAASVGLVVARPLLPVPAPLAIGVAVALFLWAAPRLPRLLWAVGGLALAIAAAAPLHARLEEARAPEDARLQFGARIAAAQARARGFCTTLALAAERGARLAEAPQALAGDRDALDRLFRDLESLRESLPEHPALAVDDVGLAPAAWAGRVADLRGYQDVTGAGSRVFVLTGTVTTTLVAAAPVRDAKGSVLGIATAELPVAVRRHISNEYLSDFDLIAGDDPGLEVRYADVRQREAQRPPAAETVLRTPGGDVLATVRAAASTAPSGLLLARYRQVLAVVAGVFFLAWGLLPGGGGPRVRLAATATALRLTFIAAPPLLSAEAGLQSPDIYASPLLGAFTRSPLDLFLTALWLALLSGLLLERALTLAPRRPAPLRAAVTALLALPVLAWTFAWVADTAANSPLDLETFALLPRSPAHALLQCALLLILAGGGALLAAVMAFGGPVPRTSSGRGAWGLGLATVAAVALWLWPRERLGLPLAPAVALFVLALALAATADTWRARMATAAPGRWAGFGILATALLAAILDPALVHYAEKSLRLQIEREDAPRVLRQPQWREYVLAEACRKIDGLPFLEEAPAGAPPALVEELAFGIWSATDLPTVGFSSAVEVQDPAGRIVSRFALNLPSLAGPPQPLPAKAEWDLHREALPAASGGGTMLHASRLLAGQGVRGAIHVYVKDDYWNLPFITGHDPYSVLYRTTSRRAVRDRRIALAVYDPKGLLTFNSTDRPPALDERLQARVREQPRGLWTTLSFDGRAYHTYLFGDPQGVYALAYPRLGAGRFAADLVEAASGAVLAALAVLVSVLLLRTLIGARWLSIPSLARSIAERFSLRLFVAFIAVALVPVAVLEVAVRGFVVDRLRKEAEDDALDRATVAKKSVENFVLFRRGEAPGRSPDLDAGLVYIASLMRNDLDLFVHGRLQASSKRELYASGLLLPRISGAVYREIALDGRPSAMATERIGGFSYLVVSVPLRVDRGEPGILSIPLALRQREVEAVLEDLDRTIRLASALFMLAAGALAHSMTRRISGPIRDLTRATQRVASGDLSARVTVASRDELRALVESFNQMAHDLERQRGDLERSNRLAAWAEMARQVAHEVKNPLTPIQLSAEHLRRVYADPSADFGAALERCTQTILKQVRTLRGIVTEFSAFARPPAGPLAPLDAVATAEEAIRPYQTVLPPGVRLRFEEPEQALWIRAERRLFERAVVNLVENALQAVGDAGSIAVRLGLRDGRVELEVEDDGPGVDPEVRERVFEPFFSTKATGSGLGLALVRKIAEDHGGGVSLESAPGRTLVALWLPAAEPEASASTPRTTSG
jgi:signal transduction histidine kinase